MVATAQYQKLLSINTPDALQCLSTCPPLYTSSPSLIFECFAELALCKEMFSPHNICFHNRHECWGWEYLPTTGSKKRNKRKCQLLTSFQRKRPCLCSSARNPTVYCGRVLNNGGLAHSVGHINPMPPPFWLNLTWTDAIKFTSVGDVAKLRLPNLFMVLSCKC